MDGITAEYSLIFIDPIARSIKPLSQIGDTIVIDKVKYIVSAAVAFTTASSSKVWPALRESRSCVTYCLVGPSRGAEFLADSTTRLKPQTPDSAGLVHHGDVAL